GIRRTAFNKTLSYMENEFIISICGVRRAGKSTLLKQLINYLIETKKIPPGNILTLNLEDPVFNFYKDDVTYLDRVYREYLKMHNPQGKVYLFLDEVQFFSDWEVFVKAKFEKKDSKIVVTGSNSRLISADMATLLSGRTLVIDMLPFSFQEVLAAGDIDTGNTVALLSQKNRVKALFDNYLIYG
ncbi:MAG: AAA family ATPase, partial [bacterium]|nr:AAA family ATPase [bacterium]